MDGWLQDTRRARKFSDLPRKARKYLRRLEELAKTDIAVVSVGSDRKETIVSKNIFK
jgi:adenylosuccinate synthase